MYKYDHQVIHSRKNIIKIVTLFKTKYLKLWFKNHLDFFIFINFTHIYYLIYLSKLIHTWFSCIKMTHLFNNDFTETIADSHNSLTWAIDVEIMPPAHVSDTTKYTISHFLRHRLHLDLKILKRIRANFGLHSKNTMINIGQSFCQKHGVSGHHFALWTSNLSQNTIMQCSWFVANFSFVIKL